METIKHFDWAFKRHDSDRIIYVTVTSDGSLFIGDNDGGVYTQLSEPAKPEVGDSGQP